MTALPKRRKRERTKPLPDRVRCPAHLQWVRGHECAASNEWCGGKIQAAHVRLGTDGAMGVKPGDNWAVPLCEVHHGGQHAVGEETFWRGIDPKDLAAKLWMISPHGKRYRAENDGTEGKMR